MAKNSKAGVAGKLPRKGQFQKGADPRRHKDGSKSRAAVEFSKNLRQLLVKEGEEVKKGQVGEQTVRLKNVEWLVKSVWRKAIAGEAWAVTFIAERVEGKISQPVDMQGRIEALIFSDKFLPDMNNGSKPK